MWLLWMVPLLHSLDLYWLPLLCTSIDDSSTLPYAVKRDRGGNRWTNWKWNRQLTMKFQFWITCLCFAVSFHSISHHSRGQVVLSFTCGRLSLVFTIQHVFLLVNSHICLYSRHWVVSPTIFHCNFSLLILFFRYVLVFPFFALFAFFSSKRKMKLFHGRSLSCEK